MNFWEKEEVLGKRMGGKWKINFIINAKSSVLFNKNKINRLICFSKNIKFNFKEIFSCFTTLVFSTLIKHALPKNQKTHPGAFLDRKVLQTFQFGVLYRKVVPIRPGPVTKLLGHRSTLASKFEMYFFVQISIT